jgi:hypothetical protein
MTPREPNRGRHVNHRLRHPDGDRSMLMPPSAEKDSPMPGPGETRRSVGILVGEVSKGPGDELRTPPSSIVPHAPQPDLPAHRASRWPYPRHDRTVRTLPMDER